jgi:hypothetical protein
VEQLAIRYLGQERMPEGIATQPVVDAIGIDEDALGDRRSKGIGDGLGRDREHGCEQFVVNAAPGRRCRPEHLLRIGREGRQAGDEHVPQSGREGTSRAVSAECRRQLLDEERIAAGPVHDVVDGGRRRGGPGQLPQQHEDVMAIEAPQVQPDDPGIPLELGHERDDRILPFQLTGPQRGQQQDRRFAQVAREEAEEPARALVGPLDVLDDEHHRAAASLALDHAEHGLEQPRLSLAVELVSRGLVVRAGRHLREQARDLVPRRSEQRGEQRGRDGPRQLPERLDEGRIRDGAAPRGQARPAEHGGPAVPGGGGDPPDQPGLSDPCLTADDDGGSASGDGRFQSGVKARFLGATTDEGSPIDTIDHSPPMIATAEAAVSRDGLMTGQHLRPNLRPGAAEQRARGDLGSADGAGDLGPAIPVRGQDESLAIDITEVLEDGTHRLLVLAGHGQALG